MGNAAYNKAGWWRWAFTALVATFASGCASEWAMMAQEAATIDTVTISAKVNFPDGVVYGDPDGWRLSAYSMASGPSPDQIALAAGMLASMPEYPGDKTNYINDQIQAVGIDLDSMVLDSLSAQFEQRSNLPEIEVAPVGPYIEVIVEKYGYISNGYGETVAKMAGIATLYSSDSRLLWSKKVESDPDYNVFGSDVEIYSFHEIYGNTAVFVRALYQASDRLACVVAEDLERWIADGRAGRRPRSDFASPRSQRFRSECFGG